MPQVKSVGKLEWNAKKKIAGNKCVICGSSEKKVGVLQKAHLKAKSSGGTQVVPMCPNCHWRYDHGKLTKAELKKIGLTPEQHKKAMPKKKKKDDWWF